MGLRYNVKLEKKTEAEIEFNHGYPFCKSGKHGKRQIFPFCFHLVSHGGIFMNGQDQWISRVEKSTIPMTGLFSSSTMLCTSTDIKPSTYN